MRLAVGIGILAVVIRHAAADLQEGPSHCATRVLELAHCQQDVVTGNRVQGESIRVSSAECVDTAQGGQVNSWHGIVLGNDVDGVLVQILLGGVELLMGQPGIWGREDDSRLLHT